MVNTTCCWHGCDFYGTPQQNGFCSKHFQQALRENLPMPRDHVSSPNRQPRKGRSPRKQAEFQCVEPGCNNYCKQPQQVCSPCQDNNYNPPERLRSISPERAAALRAAQRGYNNIGSPQPNVHKGRAPSPRRTPEHAIHAGRSPSPRKSPSPRGATPAPCPCAWQGCDLFGTPNQAGFCSSHFKEHQRQQKNLARGLTPERPQRPRGLTPEQKNLARGLTPERPQRPRGPTPERPQRPRQAAFEKQRLGFGAEPTWIEPGRLSILDDVLGQGGQGVVKVGLMHFQDNTLGKVAVKMVPGCMTWREREVLEKEIKVHWEAFRTSSHGGVCELYGACEMQGALCMVMKLYKASLAKEIRSSGLNGLRPRSYWKYTYSLCTTLQHLHDTGFILQDIKPDNVLLNEHNEPVFADFGMSVRVQGAQGDQNIMPSKIRGTFNYMAPEALDPAPFGGFTSAADMWSMGCVLVEMITGRRPWQGKNVGQIIACVSQGYKPDELDHAIRRHPGGRFARDNFVSFLQDCFNVQPRRRSDARSLASASRLLVETEP